MLGRIDDSGSFSDRFSFHLRKAHAKVSCYCAVRKFHAKVSCYSAVQRSPAKTSCCLRVHGLHGAALGNLCLEGQPLEEVSV